MRKRLTYGILTIFVIFLGVFFLYCNNTSLADRTTQEFYNELKDTLRKRGYSANLFVISTKRHGWVNNLLVWLNGAARESQHLQGNAIDFLVLDVNGDGRSDERDVDIAYKILDKEIIQGKGGLGTYKESKSFFNRQMIHIDCRGARDRWYK